MNLLNQFGERLIHEPYPTCHISIWNATVLGYAAVVEGREDDELLKIEPQLRPKLKGVTEVIAVRGRAVFNPTRVVAQLGTVITLRVLCSGATWITPLYTEKLKVGSMILRWLTPPPALVQLGKAGMATPSHGPMLTRG